MHHWISMAISKIHLQEFVNLDRSSQAMSFKSGSFYSLYMVSLQSLTTNVILAVNDGHCENLLVKEMFRSDERRVFFKWPSLGLDLPKIIFKIYLHDAFFLPSCINKTINLLLWWLITAASVSEKWFWILIIFLIRKTP